MQRTLMNVQAGSTNLQNRCSRSSSSRGSCGPAQLCLVHFSDLSPEIWPRTKRNTTWSIWTGLERISGGRGRPLACHWQWTHHWGGIKYPARKKWHLWKSTLPFWKVNKLGIGPQPTIQATNLGNLIDTMGGSRWTPDQPLLNANNKRI